MIKACCICQKEFYPHGRDVTCGTERCRKEHERARAREWYRRKVKPEARPDSWMPRRPDYGDRRVTKEGFFGLPLDPREREILNWLAEGKDNTMIAQITGISTNTVSTRVNVAMQKLGANNRVHAVALMLKAELRP